MRKMLQILLMFLLAFFCHISVMAMTPFERMDRNGDNSLSRMEFRGPPHAFGRLDRNGDGFISLSEAAGTRLSGDVPNRRGSGRTQPVSPSKKLLYIDTHNHLVGRRINGEFYFDRQAGIALSTMNELGIKLNFLMPMPQAPGQKLELKMEDLLPVFQKYPDRFALLGGGGSLNVMIQQAVKAGTVTPAMEQAFITRAEELVRKGAVGFGEMTTEHFSMNDHHPYETAPPDHPLFLRLADLAAKYNMPIDLHMEAIEKEMTMIPRLQTPQNPLGLKPNIEGFERLLNHNRKAKIIWVHLGWDNTGQRTVELTRRLLLKHPNLYLSIRIASGMKERKTVRPSFPLDGNSRLRPEWLKLFEEFPDRFLLGSDEIIKPADDHPSAGSIKSTLSLVEQLPEGLRAQIGYQNVYHIYRLSN